MMHFFQEKNSPNILVMSTMSRANRAKLPGSPSRAFADVFETTVLLNELLENMTLSDRIQLMSCTKTLYVLMGNGPGIYDLISCTKNIPF